MGLVVVVMMVVMVVVLDGLTLFFFFFPSDLGFVLSLHVRRGGEPQATVKDDVRGCAGWYAGTQARTARLMAWIIKT